MPSKGPKPVYLRKGLKLISAAKVRARRIRRRRVCLLKRAIFEKRHKRPYVPKDQRKPAPAAAAKPTEAKKKLRIVKGGTPKHPDFPTANRARPLLKRRKKHSRTPKPPQHNIRRGTVLILLAGRYRGKRVVYLKMLPSGLLLVTGPYLINKVPLRRVNRAYALVTSTRVDLKGLKLDLKDVKDSMFLKEEKKAWKTSEARFFANLKDPKRAKKTMTKGEKEAAKDEKKAAEADAAELKAKEEKKVDEKAKELSQKEKAKASKKRARKIKRLREKKEELKKKKIVVKCPKARRDLQRKIDTPLIERIKKVPHLGAYLSARFSLQDGQFPHRMKF
jgi:large subunit ribosomal protein L6e